MYYGISTRIIEIFPEGIYCHYFGEVAGVMKKFYINLCKNFGNQKEIRFLVFSLKESLEKIYIPDNTLTVFLNQSLAKFRL